MSLPRFIPALATALLLVAAQTASAARAPEAANRLQQQQLQDTLELNGLQSATGRPGGISPADAQQLDQLQSTQRMQQQQLEQRQLLQQQQESQRRRIEPDINRGGALQQQFSQERQLQMQQFDSEQQQLMNTIRAQPLQPPTSSGLQPQPNGALLRP
jgi:hypothetical protein